VYHRLASFANHFIAVPSGEICEARQAPSAIPKHSLHRASPERIVRRDAGRSTQSPTDSLLPRRTYGHIPVDLRSLPKMSPSCGGAAPGALPCPRSAGNCSSQRLTEQSTRPLAVQAYSCASQAARRAKRWRPSRRLDFPLTWRTGSRSRRTEAMAPEPQARLPLLSLWKQRARAREPPGAACCHALSAALTLESTRFFIGPGTRARLSPR